MRSTHPALYFNSGHAGLDRTPTQPADAMQVQLSGGGQQVVPRRTTKVIQKGAPQALLQRLDRDPEFQVFSLDGSVWFDPFSGRAVPAAEGARKVAVDHLRRIEDWDSRPTLGLIALRDRRWRHDLGHLLNTDPRFRLFSPRSGFWLNPFTGREEASVRRTAGEITSDTAENMVRVLAKTPAANDGSQIMAHQELLRIVGQMKALAAGADPGTVSVERPPSQPRDLRRNTGVISRQDFQVRIARTRSQATVQVPTTRNHRRMGTATVTPAKLEQEHLRRATPIGLDVASVRQPTPARSDPLRDDLVRAARAQRQLLSNPPSCEGVDLGLYFCPKDQVGGDFYEVVKRPDGSLFIALGDVSGHGVQGAVVAAGAVKTLRFLARESGSLADLVTRFNDECRSDLVTGQFVTLFAAEFHPEDKRIEFLLAGHHPLLICNISAENMVRRVGKPGMALGLADGETFRSRVETLTLELTPGDVLLQFSDALVEARNAGGEAFGLARTCAAALRHQHHCANEMAEWIADEVFQWSGGNPDDDLTVLTAALR